MGKWIDVWIENLFAGKSGELSPVHSSGLTSEILLQYLNAASNLRERTISRP